MRNGQNTMSITKLIRYRQNYTHQFEIKGDFKIHINQTKKINRKLPSTPLELSLFGWHPNHVPCFRRCELTVACYHLISLVLSLCFVLTSVSCFEYLTCYYCPTNTYVYLPVQFLWAYEALLIRWQIRRHHCYLSCH